MWTPSEHGGGLSEGPRVAGADGRLDYDNEPERECVSVYNTLRFRSSHLPPWREVDTVGEGISKSLKERQL